MIEGDVMQFLVGVGVGSVLMLIGLIVGSRRRGGLDPRDDAPLLTDELANRAQISRGGEVIRPASGTVSK